MSGFEIATTIGLPITVLIVMAVLLAIARPDQDSGGDGLYAVYLATVSIASLYVMLISLAALGEGITQHLVAIAPESQPIQSNSSYFVLGLLQGSTASIAAFATLAVLAAIAFGFHSQRRREMRAQEDFVGSVAQRVDRAHDAAMCFAMISLIFIGALIAATAGYTFFAPPVGGDQVRDVAGGQMLSYGLLVLVSWLIFRSRFWAIRGGRPDIDDDEDGWDHDGPRLAELDEPGPGS